MSCCGGNYGCGADCKCGCGCSGCGMYPDLSYKEYTAPTETFVLGVAPQKLNFEASDEVAAENDSYKCGANCSCNPCYCT